jgi:hypothetical protein
VPEFFYSKNEFLHRDEASLVGFTYVSFLWPGINDRASGRSSQGTYDFGGPACLAAWAEMADRVRKNNWEKNLDKVIRE